ncbi:hypothetical protein IJG04_02135 [Candidatus Saccharibacteria bacterium]|nr:hypothetical protein [Candidatus Saccharibacteria bacterium]
MLRKNRIKWMAVIMFVLGLFSTAGVCYADYYGTGSGSGGKPGCPKPFSTCYGATWRYYSWDDAYNGKIAGMRALTSADVGGAVTSDKVGDIFVEGTNSNFRAFANGTAKTGKTISKSCKDVGGFYRYAMVANSSYTYKSTDTGGSDGGKDAGLSVIEDAQYGFLGISSNANPKFNSEFFRSSGQTSVNYIDKDFSWRSVYNEFWKNKNNPNYASLYAGMEWGSGDLSDGDPFTYATNLSWFCAPKEGTDIVTVAAQSNISNSALGGYSTTGKNSSGILKTINTSKASVNIDDTVTITFSHNLYGAASVSNVSWTLTRSGLAGGSSYSVEKLSGSGVGVGRNPANLTVLGDGSYLADDRPGFDGATHFLAREQYKVTFKVAGTYKFCEMLGVVQEGSNVNLTQVCTEVTAGTTPGVCGTGGLGQYVSGVTSVLSRVKNERIVATAYSGWKTQTYAKPGDKAVWTNCYFPGVQEYANKDLVELNSRIVGSHGADSGCSCTSNSYKKFQDAITWTNQVRLETTSPSGFNELRTSRVGALKMPTSGYLPYTKGDNTIRTYANDRQINLVTDVGKSFYDYIYTPGTPVTVSWGSTNHSWSACCGCGCCRSEKCTCKCCRRTRSHCNSYTYGTSTSGSRSDKSTITIPYNYENSAEVSLAPTDGDVAYSGEKIAVNRISVNVGVKDNSLTEGKYATIVRNARVKMVAYVSNTDDGGSGARVDVGSGSGQDICVLVSKKGSECDTVVDSGTTVLNPDGELLESEGVKNFAYNHRSIEKIGMNSDGTLNRSSPRDYVNFAQNYVVFDSNAGDYYCVAIAVFPSKSGSNDNIDPNGNNKWYVSRPVCKIIAKRPSLQVYGGDVYSSGSINVEDSEAIKYHVYGTTYDRTPKNSTVFDSFAEQSIVANGIVNAFASGASTGLSSSGVGVGNQEGRTPSFCSNRVPLSVANSTSKSITGGICDNFPATGLAGVSSGVENRSSLASYWVPDNTETAVKSGDISISLADMSASEYAVASSTGKNVRYLETDGSISLSGGSIGKDSTFVIKAGGNIDINGNLTYLGDFNYVSPGEIPKLVIYSGGNIRISCAVEQIDALIIAGGEVNTCNDYESVGSAVEDPSINNSERSKRLMIRGVVISNTLTPSRTYGASRGVGSNPDGIPLSGSAAAAEVINYDTSAILWGRYMAGSAESDVLTTVYQHELAPRY